MNWINAALLGLVLAVVTPAHAEMNHHQAIMSDCDQLMAGIRGQFGRAPICMYAGEENSGVDQEGLMLLSDDLHTYWGVIQIVVDPSDITRYHYSQNAYLTIINAVGAGRGLTDAQEREIAEKYGCTQIEAQSRRYMDNGQISYETYKEWVARAHCDKSIVPR